MNPECNDFIVGIGWLPVIIIGIASLGMVLFIGYIGRK
jgi:hypothetical protein